MFNLNLLKREAKCFLGLRSKKPKPHFLGIGTQKGGTTSLYKVLKSHSDVFLPENKEIHYFTKYYNLGNEWYIKQFEDAKPGKIRGEITPYYLFHESVPERIKQFNAKTLLVVLLRNPVERTLSQYFHSVRLGLEDLSLEDALNIEEERLAASKSIVKVSGNTHVSHQEHSYLSRSKYDEQIKRYLNYFDKKNLLILKSEDLFKNNYSSLNLLSKFLGIKKFPKTVKVPNENRGKGESAQVPQRIKEQIIGELAYTYQWIEKELGITWDF